MNYATKTKIEFTAYANTVIKNFAINYRKTLRSAEKEISVADYASLPVGELLSVDDSSFFMERDITYANIEMMFTDERHYRAMKKLSDNDKQILFMTIIEEMKAEQVSKILDITKDSVKTLKSRAIKRFLENLHKIS